MQYALIKDNLKSSKTSLLVQRNNQLILISRMFFKRLLASAFYVSRPVAALHNSPVNLYLTKFKPVIYLNLRKFSLLSTNNWSMKMSQTTMLFNNNLIKPCNEVSLRSVTKYSLRKGKRKTVKTVLKRFYRLDWGGWIRTIAGRHRRIWNKSPQRRQRMKHHVLCNATQSTLLDKMVNNYWRKPKYYVDDPYEPYHMREEHIYTYKKPKPYYPKE